MRVPRLGVEVRVPRDVTMLDALEAAGVGVLWDCRRGECGLCAIDVLEVEGTVDHRDVFFSEAQHAENRKICACVSRVVGGCLSVDPPYRGDGRLTPGAEGRFARPGDATPPPQTKRGARQPCRTASRHSAPTTSAACCVRRSCATPGPRALPAASTPHRCARWKTAASATPSRGSRSVGLRAVTDGEYRRAFWHFDFLARLGGVEMYESDQGIQFKGGQTKAYGLKVTGPIRYAAAPLRRGLPLRRREGGRRGAEADHPLALGAALPRRPQVGGHPRLSDDGRLLRRPRRGLCRRGGGFRRSRLPLPAARRGEHRLSLRPGADRGAPRPRRARRGAARDLCRPDQRRHRAGDRPR